MRLVLALGSLAVPVSAQVELAPSDGIASQAFGYAVALAGDTVLVGSPLDDGAGGAAGSAYVFHDPVGPATWTQVAKLTASDAAPLEYFGAAVACTGTTALVGAPGSFDATGAVYVFMVRSGAWSEVQKLTPSGPQLNFGSAVAQTETWAIIGAPANNTALGAAFVFEKQGTGWARTATLVGADTATGDLFGGSVAISGDRAVIGAHEDDDGGPSSGSAYVFEKLGTSWLQTAKLTASDAAANDDFGTSVALYGDTVVVGAPLESDSEGAAYVFELHDGEWEQTAKLTAPEDDRFGQSVSAHEDVLAVGAHRGGVLADSGAVHVFRRAGAGWVQVRRLLQANPSAGDLFGFSAALWKTSLVAGTFPLAFPGRAFAYDLGAPDVELYCSPAAPNQTGMPAQLGATGSTSVAANDLVFSVAPLAPGNTGLVAYSPDTASSPLDNGTLCLGTSTLGFVVRLPGEAPDAEGVMRHALDLTAPPVPAGQITVGSTWSFQAWNRDFTPGGQGSNFSDALRITFRP